MAASGLIYDTEDSGPLHLWLALFVAVITAVIMAAWVERVIAAGEDFEDRFLFQPLGGEMVTCLLRVKHNSPNATKSLHEVKPLSALSARAVARLSEIISHSTRLDHLILRNVVHWGTNYYHPGSLQFSGVNHRNLSELCVGLHFNCSITSLELSSVPLGDDGMSLLVRFLSNNPNLRQLLLRDCNLNSDGIDLLSNALLERPRDSLSFLNLSRNNMRNADLDNLVLALKKSRQMKTLVLSGSGISTKGCASLAKLLSDPHSNLQCLNLGQNSMDDSAVGLLVDALAENTKLKALKLNLSRNSNDISAVGWSNNRITAVGLSKLLKLVCNSTSIDSVLKSNHVINSLGIDSVLQSILTFERFDKEAFDRDASLLRASLKINASWTRSNGTKSKTKILWSHARGDLNIGATSIALGVLPCILSWIGDGTNKATAGLIQYHNPPLPNGRIDAIRLDSLYRIVRSRPELCGKCTNKSSEAMQPLGVIFLTVFVVGLVVNVELGLCLLSVFVGAFLI